MKEKVMKDAIGVVVLGVVLGVMFAYALLGGF
jgi:hypothetical protein